MTVFWTILQYFILSGISGVIGNRTDDALMKIYEHITKKSWDELYYEAFEYAIQSDKQLLPVLEHLSNGQASIDREAIRKVLDEKFDIDITSASYAHLQENEKLEQLIDAMADANILQIPNYKLDKQHYRRLVETLVTNARSNFRHIIEHNEPTFKKAALDLLGDDHALLVELKFATEQLGIVLKLIADKQDFTIAYLETSKKPEFGAKPRVFVSYARDDGETFASELRTRIEAEGIAVWRDRDRMEGGKGWWKQIESALNVVEFMVLVVTPSALASPNIKKEWQYARQQGVCIYPVIVPDKEPDFNLMPLWMSKSHFYHLDKEWETFINYVKTPCTAVRVPFMARDLPDSFVKRAREFELIITQILDKNRDNPLAITTSLNGAGGFGKTTLALAICHDPNVQTAFVDGILWVDLGENANVIGQLGRIYTALTGDTAAFVDVFDGAKQVADKLQDKHCLIVIDDVWHYNNLEPFLEGGDNCTRLITTRFAEFAVRSNSKIVEVDEMATDESLKLLLHEIEMPDDLEPFKKMSHRLGEWALLLEITNGILRERIALANTTLENALERVNKMLDRHGIVRIVRNDENKRRQGALGVLAASLDLLKDAEKQHLYELSIFRDDRDVYLPSIEILWGMDDLDTEDLLMKFRKYSLLRYDMGSGFIRLHDVIREVLDILLSEITPPQRIHERLIDNYSNFYNLPDDYIWNNLAYHLKLAGREEQLHSLLLDLAWLQAKLNKTDIIALLDDFTDTPAELSEISLIQSALTISSYVLSIDSDQLSSQLYARLLGQRHKYPKIDNLLNVIETSQTFILLPTQQTLLSAGSALIRSMQGHFRGINAIALLGDNVISASSDKTLKVWNWKTGREERTLKGHTDWVRAVALSGDYAVSASSDKTLKVWNWKTGREERTLQGHTDWVNGVALSGDYAVSASSDKTLKVWNWKTGQEIRTLKGHNRYVLGVALSGDYAVSASSDKTLKVWNWKTGQEIRTLKGHRRAVNAVALAGDYAVSVSSDKTLKVWNWKLGEEIRTLQGHSSEVLSVALARNYAVTTSADETLKVWDWKSGEEEGTLKGHTNWIRGVVISEDYAISASSDQTLKVWNWKLSEREWIHQGHSTVVRMVMQSGDYAVSASSDKTLKVWNWKTGQEIRTLNGHDGWVNAVALSGDYAVSASSDKTLKVWNWKTGQEERTLYGHVRDVNTVALSGDYAVSASSDKTLKVWNWKTGKEIRTLRGHSSDILGIALSDDYAVSVGDDKRLKVWNWKTGQEIRTLKGHSNWISAVVLSEDYAISASADETLKVWNWKTGQEIRTLKGHSTVVRAVALSGNYAVSASSDRTLKVWNWKTGEYLTTFTTDSPQWTVSIAGNGEMIVSGGSSGHIHFLRSSIALYQVLQVI